MNQEEYLEHYGVKGMRWGVRHDRKRSSSSGRKKQVKDIKKKAKTASKYRSTLSDAELDRRVSRLEREKKLRTLTESEVSPGKTAAKKLLSKYGAQVASVFVGAIAGGAATYTWEKLHGKLP